ncbi:hypothetical protein CDV31_015974 [Fusarium ambrosium]|uniref:Uncharacterized protein n=1 Tax=Fusarium ambrosium TaxID=131363 RepID=A0A428SGI1_9HYPO|nr:hypothetical protein CDV31_015974 [Fusarium ambrosium]
MLSPEIDEVAGLTGSWITPFSDRARKKRTVFIWTCCSCLASGMRVTVSDILDPSSFTQTTICPDRSRPPIPPPRQTSLPFFPKLFLSFETQDTPIQRSSETTVCLNYAIKG